METEADVVMGFSEDDPDEDFRDQRQPTPPDYGGLSQVEMTSERGDQSPHGGGSIASDMHDEAMVDRQSMSAGAFGNMPNQQIESRAMFVDAGILMRQRRGAPMQSPGMPDNPRKSPATASNSNGPRNDDDSNQAERSNFHNAAAMVGHFSVRNVRNFDPAKLGENIIPKPPVFKQSRALLSPWMEHSAAGTGAHFRPKRSMCWNIPVKCFAPDGSKFYHWTTPLENPIRAINLAAVLSLMFTPMQKGFKSGRHEEDYRAAQAAQGQQDEGRRTKEPEKVKRVHRYTFVSPQDHNYSLPMYTIGYQEIYDRLKKNVTFIRIWLHVFDEEFSLSELVRMLMDENANISAAAGVASCPAHLRSNQMVKEAEKIRSMTGGKWTNTKLEYYAAMQYGRIDSESMLMRLLGSIGGETTEHKGKPCMQNIEEDLPAGVLDQRLTKDPDGLGGTHFLAPEKLWCAKDETAFNSGFINLDGTEGDVHPDYTKVENYFDMVTGDFRVSDTDIEMGGYFHQTDSTLTSIWQCPLPRPIGGSVNPGPALLKLYKERMANHVSINSPQLLDYFKNMMTETDQFAEKLLKSFHESGYTFDTHGVTDQMRTAIDSLRTYGKDEDGAHIMQQREVLLELAQDTQKVKTKLITPWEHQMTKRIDDVNMTLRSGANIRYEQARVTDYPEHFAPLMKMRREFAERRVAIHKELFVMQAKRMEQAFTSRADKSTIPPGYIAAYDGLYSELKGVDKQSANVAYALSNQMMDSDRTVFGNLMDMMCRFYEDDAFIDGRDWCHVQELIPHCFEQFDLQTLLLFLLGPKGNGKSTRTERFMEVFPPGWVVATGPGSSKSGMNGHQDQNNGCNTVYDEITDDLCAQDGSERVEYWKRECSP